MYQHEKRGNPILKERENRNKNEMWGLLWSCIGTKLTRVYFLFIQFLSNIAQYMDMSWLYWFQWNNGSTQMQHYRKQHKFEGSELVHAEVYYLWRTGMASGTTNPTWTNTMLEMMGINWNPPTVIVLPTTFLNELGGNVAVTTIVPPYPWKFGVEYDHKLFCKV